MKEHLFKIHNYKKPTFCRHCNSLLVGLVKQGVRCKRCKIDVHEKCQDLIDLDCVSVTKGKHNFILKTYHSPTYCDQCKGLLVGLVNQGLRCSECKCNVHEKCKKDFEDNRSCIQNTSKLPESRRNSLTSTKLTPPASTGLPTSRRNSLTPEPPRKQQHQPLKRQKSFDDQEIAYSDNEEDTTQPSAVFLKMDNATDTDQSKSSKSTPQKKNTNVQQLDHVVGDVIDIMMRNAKALEERGEGLEQLEDNAANLAESTEIFKKKAEDISKKYWWKSKKLTIAIVAIVLMIVVVIITVAVIEAPTIKK